MPCSRKARPRQPASRAASVTEISALSGSRLLRSVVNHFAIDNREDRAHSADRFVRHLLRIEIVGIQHHYVAQFTGNNRTQFVLLAEEPPVFRGVETQRLVALNLLSRV